MAHWNVNLLCDVIAHTAVCHAYGGVSCSQLLDLVQMDLESVHFSERVPVM